MKTLHAPPPGEPELLPNTAILQETEREREKVKETKRVTGYSEEARDWNIKLGREERNSACLKGKEKERERRM